MPVVPDTAPENVPVVPDTAPEKVVAVATPVTFIPLGNDGEPIPSSALKLSTLISDLF